MDKIRRKEKQLEQEAGLNMLRAGEFGILSLVDQSGGEVEPYAVPLSYALEDAGTSLVCHCALEGRKLRALAVSSRAQFTVVGPTRLIPEKFSTKYSSVMAFGRVERVTDPEEKRHALLAIADKYSPGYRVQAEEYIARSQDKVVVLRFCIEDFSAKGTRE